MSINKDHVVITANKALSFSYMHHPLAKPLKEDRVKWAARKVGNLTEEGYQLGLKLIRNLYLTGDTYGIIEELEQYNINKLISQYSIVEPNPQQQEVINKLPKDSFERKLYTIKDIIPHQLVASNNRLYGFDGNTLVCSYCIAAQGIYRQLVRTKHKR